MNKKEDIPEKKVALLTASEFRFYEWLMSITSAQETDPDGRRFVNKEKIVKKKKFLVEIPDFMVGREYTYFQPMMSFLRTKGVLEIYWERDRIIPNIEIQVSAGRQKKEKIKDEDVDGSEDPQGEAEAESPLPAPPDPSAEVPQPPAGDSPPETPPIPESPPDPDPPDPPADEQKEPEAKEEKSPVPANEDKAKSEEPKEETPPVQSPVCSFVQASESERDLDGGNVEITRLLQISFPEENQVLFGLNMVIVKTPDDRVISREIDIRTHLDTNLPHKKG